MEKNEVSGQSSRIENRFSAPYCIWERSCQINSNYQLIFIRKKRTIVIDAE